MFRKVFLAALIVVCCVCDGSGAQKCIAINPDNMESVLERLVGFEGESGQSDWSVILSDMTIRGIGVCSSYPSGNVVVEKLIHERLGKLDTCWCKMIRPAISHWVFVHDYDSIDECNSDCGNFCATSFFQRFYDFVGSLNAETN